LFIAGKNMLLLCNVWDAQNIWEHAVLPITKEKINQLLQNRPKPVFAINSYTSGAIVGRSHTLQSKSIFLPAMNNY